MTQGSAEQQAIDSLFDIANSHRPDARQAANFMLAWWNAAACGGFDLQDLRQMGPRLGESVAEIMDMIWQVGCGPEHLGYSNDFKELVAKWRSHSDAGSLGTWRAPSLMAALALTIQEHQALDRLLKTASAPGPAQHAATSVLLAWLDAARYGGLDPRALAGLPAEVFEDILCLVRLISRCRCHPGATGYGAKIERLAATLQPAPAPAPNWVERLRPAKTLRRS